LRGTTDEELNEIREGLTASIEGLATALLGQPTSKVGGTWRYGRKGALAVETRGPNKGQWYDHEAGEGGDPLALIRREQGGDFASTLQWARNFLGVGDAGSWTPQKRKPRPEAIEAEARREAEGAAERARRLDYARKMLRDTQPVAETVGAIYLQATRGILCPGAGFPAEVVRFHAGRCALILAATDAAGDLRGVQLVYLTQDGQKIGQEEAERRKLPGAKQSFGPQEGAAVRLPAFASDGIAPDALQIAEGPETGLSVWASTGRETWIALGGVGKLDLPADRLVIVCADDDPKEAPASRALRKAYKQWKAAGLKLVAAFPWTPRRFDKSDFNDLLREAGPEAVRVQIDAPLAPPPEPHYPAPKQDRDRALLNLRREGERFFADASRTVAVRHEWEAIKAQVEEVHEVGTPERRRALHLARKAMAARHGKGWQAPGRRLLMPAAAGGGKTRLAANMIAAAGDALGQVFFATDKLQNAEAVASAIPGAMVARGRGQIDPDDPEGHRMCWRPDAADAVARAGLPVGTTLCDDGKGKVCPFKSQCGWQREAAKMRDGTLRTIAGSHEYLAVRGAAPTPDVVVVDEAPIKALTGHASFGLDRVLPDAMPGWQAAGIEAVQRHREIMAKVSAAIPDPAGILAGLRSRGITSADDLQPALTFLRAVEEQDFTTGITPDMDDGAVVDQLRQHQRSEIGLVIKMLAALAAEVGLSRDHAHGVSYDPDRPVKVDGKTERQARVFIHYRKPLSFPSDRPVLLLDASADPAIYRSLFGERLEVADAVRCERNVEVVQVRDYTMVRGTLLGTDGRGKALSDGSMAKAAQLRAQVVDVVNALAAKHGGEFLVAANMPVEGLLAPLLEETVLTGHYGALRGRNDYEECPAGLILGREEPPASAMEDVARAIFAADPEPLNLTGAYIKAKRGIRRRDGAAEVVDVTVHPDNRVQSILELNRERESEQAADRLRLIHNPKRKTLYVACNVPLDLTVDRTVTWRELVHEVTGQIDNQKEGKGRRINGNRLTIAWERSGGVLPLSRGELVRIFKDLWGSERSTREDLERWRSWRREYSIAETATFHPVLARYRLKGQRCPTPVLVAVGGDEGRRLVEALVGPLAAFEVVEPPEPEPPPAGDPKRLIPISAAEQSAPEPVAASAASGEFRDKYAQARAREGLAPGPDSPVSIWFEPPGAGATFSDHYARARDAIQPIAERLRYAITSEQGFSRGKKEMPS
jgi:hypothetical protein